MDMEEKYEQIICKIKALSKGLPLFLAGVNKSQRRRPSDKSFVVHLFLKIRCHDLRYH